MMGSCKPNSNNDVWRGKIRWKKNQPRLRINRIHTRVIADILHHLPNLLCLFRTSIIKPTIIPQWKMTFLPDWYREWIKSIYRRRWTQLQIPNQVQYQSARMLSHWYRNGTKNVIQRNRNLVLIKRQKQIDRMEMISQVKLIYPILELRMSKRRFFESKAHTHSVCDCSRDDQNALRLSSNATNSSDTSDYDDAVDNLADEWRINGKSSKSWMNLSLFIFFRFVLFRFLFDCCRQYMTIIF